MCSIAEAVQAGVCYAESAEAGKECHKGSSGGKGLDRGNGGDLDNWHKSKLRRCRDETIWVCGRSRMGK